MTEVLWDKLKIGDPAAYIRETFEVRPFLSWSDVIDYEHRRRTRGARQDITEMVRDAIVARVTEPEETDDEQGGRR